MLLNKCNCLWGRAWAHTGKARDPKGAATGADALRRATSTVFAGMLTIGGISYYLAQAKKDKRLEQCEYLPENDDYKASNIR